MGTCRRYVQVVLTQVHTLHSNPGQFISFTAILMCVQLHPSQIHPQGGKGLRCVGVNVCGAYPRQHVPHTCYHITCTCIQYAMSIQSREYHIFSMRKGKHTSSITQTKGGPTHMSIGGKYSHVKLSAVSEGL